ncbi:hypothetical protein NM688_g8154 [Phlebia brevispora]|uniref:Uncharacterized protein n=1 Tax=Phlebia brevispora TaxID=194682 RepID=A0ACC1RWL8_9APHY|nr:hypothetical protein NM688_g8154 [Phlebia brevispora]
MPALIRMKLVESCTPLPSVLSDMATKEDLLAALRRPTGWAAMAKTVRDKDEEKVEDCKDDMDTLLVFAGLFSSVLTTLVVESYQSLSPDKMDTVIELLGRIANQTAGYTISVNTVNSTIPAVTTPPQSDTSSGPPFLLRRANQLWFSSLILTLTTASLAMLVKQWLREYLALDYTSSRERLRACQFRYPGLQHWFVFEIAGTLPLLLQFALGLFFLGMCFFTWSANPGLGQMSTGLISGWVFLFMSATILPISSPRCPYKTTLLKRVMRSVRPRIYQALKGIYELIHRRKELLDRLAEYFLEESEAIQRNADEVEILKEIDTRFLDDDILATTITDLLVQSSAKPSAIIGLVLHALNNRRLKGSIQLTTPLRAIPDLRALPQRCWTAVSNLVAHTTVEGLKSLRPTDSATAWPEDALRLLLAISDHPRTPSFRDALFACTRKVAESGLGSVFKERGRPPQASHPMHAYLSSHLQTLLSSTDSLAFSDIVTSAFTIYVSSDYQYLELTLPLRSPIELEVLDESEWKFSSDVLGQAILAALTSPGDTDGNRLEDAVVMLMSRIPHEITATGTEALVALAENAALRERFGNCLRGLADPNQLSYSHILSRLRILCENITLEEPMVWILRETCRSVLHPPQAVDVEEWRTLSFLIHDHASNNIEWMLSYIPLLMDRLKEASEAESRDWPPGALESLYGLLSYPHTLSQLSVDAPSAIFQLISAPGTAASALHPLVSTDDELRSSIKADIAIQSVVSLVSEVDRRERVSFFRTTYLQCGDYNRPEDIAIQHDTISKLNVVRLCTLVSKAYAKVHTLKDRILDSVASLFYEACATSMERFIDQFSSISEDEQADTLRLAKELLSTLDSLDSMPVGVDLKTWIRDFPLYDSILPDTLFQQLELFVSEADASRFKRIQRLRYKQIPRGHAVFTSPKPGEKETGPPSPLPPSFSGDGDGVENADGAAAGSSHTGKGKSRATGRPGRLWPSPSQSDIADSAGDDEDARDG